MQTSVYALRAKRGMLMFSEETDNRNSISILGNIHIFYRSSHNIDLGELETIVF